MADDRTYIKVHDGIEDHPKIVALSDAAFRLLVTTWGWCSRHHTDGRVPISVWRKRGTAKARRELVDGLLAEQHDAHVQMHDYLEHQRSAVEIAAKKEEKRAAGVKGAHMRWHTSPDKADPGCPLCDQIPPESGKIPEKADNRSPSETTVTDRSTSGGSDALTRPNVSTVVSRTHDTTHDGTNSYTYGKTWPETETETDIPTHLGTGAPEGDRASPQKRAAALNGTARSGHATKLVEAYARSRRQRPPRRVLAKLGPLVDELLAEKWPDQLIKHALDAWGDKGLDPAVFPSVANEIANAVHPARAAPSVHPTDAAVARLLTDQPSALEGGPQ